MKKFFAALIAASMLTAPLASAQEMMPRHQKNMHDDRRVIHKQTKIIEKNRWTTGRKLTRNDRRVVVQSRDYGRHNLRRPGRGQQWVRVDNQYLLISAATGLILGLAAAR